MRKRFRKKGENNQHYVMIGSLCALITMMSVGYAAFATNLNITAKGNLRPKPVPITIPELEELKVTSGEGLYIDTFEENRFVYKGENPNNYITFNDELYYIIAIEPDDSLKIRKVSSLENRAWNTTLVNAWNTSSLNKYLNETYYSTIKQESQKHIVEYQWPAGAVTYDNSDLAGQITNEKSNLYTAKVGLMSLSDYFRANTNMELCGNFNINQSNNETCKETNYLEPSSGNVWTINPYISNTTQSFRINIYGGIWWENVTSNMGVYPTFYLSSNISLLGDGTEKTPYTIVEE